MTNKRFDKVKPSAHHLENQARKGDGHQIPFEAVQAIVESPSEVEEQPDGRLRFFGEVDGGDGVVRVVASSTSSSTYSGTRLAVARVVTAFKDGMKSKSNKRRSS